MIKNRIKIVTAFQLFGISPVKCNLNNLTRPLKLK